MVFKCLFNILFSVSSGYFISDSYGEEKSKYAVKYVQHCQISIRF